VIGRGENKVEDAPSSLFSIPTTVTCQYHAREQSSFLNEFRTHAVRESKAAYFTSVAGGGGGARRRRRRREEAAEEAAAAVMEEAAVGSYLLLVHTSKSHKYHSFFLSIKWNGNGGWRWGSSWR
jgi:hypothetical protein